ncbi:hypothetical protein B0H13DRAFT_2314642 [Mycena leptocephala]|nr:hypothetical protein B0H13DRAFT_2314642 [Mycena leptocephala]
MGDPPQAFSTPIPSTIPVKGSSVNRPPQLSTKVAWEPPIGHKELDRVESQETGTEEMVMDSEKGNQTIPRVEVAARALVPIQGQVEDLLFQEQEVVEAEVRLQEEVDGDRPIEVEQGLQARLAHQVLAGHRVHPDPLVCLEVEVCLQIPPQWDQMACPY